MVKNNARSTGQSVVLVHCVLMINIMIVAMISVERNGEFTLRSFTSFFNYCLSYACLVIIPVHRCVLTVFM